MDQATTIKLSVSPMLYLLKLLGGQGTKHQVFKLLYFADRDHLSRFGRTVSGDSYIAMENGPVPTCLYDAVKKVEGKYKYYIAPGEVETLSQFFSLSGNAMIVAKQDADLNYLSKSDIDSLDLSFSEHGQKSYLKRTVDSHGPAWHSTYLNGKINEIEIAKEAGASKGLLHYITSMK